MDPSTPTAQDVQSQSSSDQPVSPTQQSPSVQLPQPVQTPPKTQVTISSGNKEGQPSMMVAESPDGDEEDEVKSAPQETKTQVVGQQGGGIEEEVAEIRPSVPEISASPEVEKVIEKSSDQEKPEIPKVLQDAGVTHSGPGIPVDVDVKQNSFGVKKLPITYQQAAVEEKVTKLHDSKHWLMGTVMYIWRKLHPKLGKNGVVAIENSIPAATEQIEIEKGEIEVQASTKSEV